MNTELPNAIKLYKKNEPETLRNLLESEVQFVDRDVIDILDCICLLKPNTLSMFTEFIEKQDKIVYLNNLYNENGKLLEAAPADFKQFYETFIRRNYYDIKEGQEILECVANLNYRLDSFPERKEPWIRSLAKDILDNKDNYTENLLFIFNRCQKFIEDTFEIKSEGNILAQCLKKSLNQNVSHLLPSIEKVEIFDFNSKLNQDLADKPTSRKRKI